METKEKPLTPEEKRKLEVRTKQATEACTPIKNQDPKKQLEAGLKQLACVIKATTKEALAYLIDKDGSIDQKQKESLKKDIDRYFELTEKLTLSITNDKKKLSNAETAEIMGLMSKLNKYLEQAKELELIPK